MARRRDGGETVSTAAIALEKRSRATELRLLALAFGIVLAAYTLLGLVDDPRPPAGTIGYGLALAALAGVAHVAVRRFAPSADPILLPCAYLLNGLGLVLIRRLDLATGAELALAQTRWTVVGIGLFALTLLVLTDHRSLARYQYTAGLITLVLLLLPLLPAPIGREVGGARIWIQLGPLNFQPGEIAKITMVIFLAAYIEQKRALLSVATNRVGPLLLPAGRHLAPVIVAAVAAIGIQVILQNDFGMSLLFFGAFVLMLYIGTGRLAYPGIGGIVFVVGAVIAYAGFGHVRRRFEIWINPWADIHDAGFQIAQSLFALGTGGVTGSGLGLGHPQTVPAAATDAIFVVLGEELGLLGATAVLACFAIIVAKGFKTALVAGDDLGTLLAAGLSALLAIQIFLIVGGVSRLVPLTGITLPFMSYGGSSLVSNYLLLALLIRISDSARRRARTPVGAEKVS
jgi:cell division protein FtsW (lipid II flippase)